MNAKSISRKLTTARKYSISIFLLCTLMQIGCTDNGKNTNVEDAKILVKTDSSTSVNWVDVLIKFNPNTTAEMRDMSIRAIEKLILDSVKVMRKGNFPNFSPTFMVSNNQIVEPLTYGFKAVATASTAPPIKDTACTCARNCGVCVMLQNFLHSSPTGPISGVLTPSPSQNILSISDPVN
jgi:hypothetical protein